MRKGDLENDQKESKDDQKESGDVQEKTKNDQKKSVKSLPETIFDAEKIKEAILNIWLSKLKSQKRKPSDSTRHFQKGKPSKNIVVKLDQSLNNKLVKKESSCG
ncbi:hypothetical protein CEXT_380471 [Caerostris extrusa]|uniref:Uncharacterized protein n=1 Tax=Caerostris extrusa TaxID=172846 RepID=A0AAV4M3W6_CAEEX|nr:hypothetical protein CEXT_380471 [Caerostris extrusa]